MDGAVNMQKNVIVEQYIRERIASGAWACGTKLPSESVLQKKLGVSQTTLRISLKTLANEGLIDRRARSGSFVCERPNRRYVILVAPLADLSLPTGYHMRYMIEGLSQLIAKAGLIPYVHLLPGALNIRKYSFDELRNHPIISDCAGMIGLVGLTGFRDEIMAHNMACVEIVSGEPVLRSATFFDLKNKDELCLRQLQMAGITSNIAVFSPDFGDSEPQLEFQNRVVKPLRKLAAKYGIDIRPEMIIPVRPNENENWGAAYSVFKDFWQNAAVKPRAVFFHLDTVTIAALPAILELGIKVPEELAIITHANQDEDFCFTLPLDRAVYDLNRVVNEAWCLLRRQLDADMQPETVKIKAEFKPGKTIFRQQRPMRNNGTFRLIGQQELLRPATNRDDYTAWKRVTTYAFVEGFETYSIDSDIWGNDRYGNFVEVFRDDDGNTSSRMLSPLDLTQAKVPTLMELFVGLDPLRNTVWRVYSKGIFDKRLEEWAGNADFTKNATLLLEYSRNGGRTFYPALNASDLALQELNATIITSCGKLTALPDGRLLMPFYVKYHDPARPLHEIVVLNAIPNRSGSYDWRFSAPIAGIWQDRGFDLTESTLALLADGRIVCFMRAENYGTAGVPPFKWISESSDNGMSWSPVRPLTLVGGREIYSPSTCGYALEHSSGRLFYLSNFYDDAAICDGCGPRYKLDIAEVDQQTLELIPETLFTFDRRQPDECQDLALSNFWVWEDRRSRDIVIDCPRAYMQCMAPGNMELRRTRINFNHAQPKNIAEAKE